MRTDNIWQENSLNPNNWDRIYKSGTHILKNMLDYLENIDEKKVFELVPLRDLKRFEEPLPVESNALEEVFDDLLNLILSKYSAMNLHPGFFGWAMGSGNPVGILSGIIENSLNANVIGKDQIAGKIEEQAIQWFKELFGYSAKSAGIMTSGCSEANLIALTVARNSLDSKLIQEEGLAAAHKPYIIYASSEVHCSVVKAIQILGIGKKNLRLVPVDKYFCMNTDLLDEMIAEDIKNGFCPACIVVNIGSVNTGALDDIEKISDIAKKYNIWLHADGAFGIFSYITKKYRERKKSLELLDSVAFDLHKWMNVQYPAGCVIIKESNLYLETFRSNDDYIEHKDEWFSDYGIALSRSFNSLKAWLFFKIYGVNKLIECIEKNMTQADYLYQTLKKYPFFELIGPPSTNIVCFRYINPGDCTEDLNKINKALLSKLIIKGESFPSGTIIDGKFFIRACFMNYRTELKHIDRMIENIIEDAKNLLKRSVDKIE